MPAEESTIPFGYCHCGCGKRAPINTRTQTKDGHLKGQPARFIRYHRCHLPILRKPSRALKWLQESLDPKATNESCVLWPFHRTKKGYGQIKFNGRMVLAHRLAFYLKYGHWPLPQACHKCDTPACVNVLHLFEGTPKENSEDNSRKLRHGNMKLTPEKVIAIRAEYVSGKEGCGYSALGKKYNVHRIAIFKIMKRMTWAFLP